MLIKRNQAPYMKNSINRLLSWPAFYPISLVALIAVFFLESFFRDSMFLPHPHWEFTSQWYPYLIYNSSMWKAGEVPLWSHNLLAGFPLAAFPHAGAFYPPLIIPMVFDFTRAFPLFVMFHLVCRVLFLYFLLRDLGRSYSSSWLCAAIFGLCGWSMHLTPFLEMFVTFTWIPGIYWLGFRLVRRGRWQEFLGLVAMSTMGYLAGDLEILLYSWMVLFALLIFVEKAPPVRLIILGLGLVVSVFICAAPFLLTLHYLQHSYRGALEFNPALTQWKWLSSEILFLFSFSYPGDMKGFLGYAGLLFSLGFLAAALDLEKRRMVWVLVIILAVGTMYYINLWPVNYIFNSLPIIGYSSVDSRFRLFFPVQMVILILAAGGFDRMKKGIDTPSLWLIAGFTILFIIFQAVFVAMEINAARGPRIPILVSRVVFIFTVAALAWYIKKASRGSGQFVFRPSLLVLVFFLDLFAFSYLSIPRTDPAELERPIKHPVLEKPDVPYRLHCVSIITSILREDVETWKMLRLDQGPGFIIGFIRNGLMRTTEIMKDLIPFSYIGHEIFRDETQPLLNFLSVRYVFSNKAPVRHCDPLPVDLPFWKSSYEESDKYVSARPPGSGRNYRVAPGSIWTVSVDLMAGDALAMTVRPPEAAPGLMVRVGAPEHGKTISWAGSEPITGEAGRRRMALPVDPTGDQYLAIIVSEETGRPVEIIAPEVTNPTRPYKILMRERYQFYENRQYLDHYGIYTAVTVADDQTARDLLFDPDRFDPSSRLILSPEAVDPRIPEQDARSRKRNDVKVKEYTSNRVALETEISSPAYLSIAESYFPGWRAWVDGEEAKVIRANYAYQAVALPEPGRHRVVLKFLPAEFRIGLWVSLVTVALALVAAAERGIKSTFGIR
jgi:hypothetical protein